MCFSATASFTASAVLATVGLACIRRMPDRRYVLFAAIPLLFAVQQGLEGIVWMSYDWGTPTVRTWAVAAYSVFSHVLWPVYVPAAVWLVETHPQRRRLLGWLALAGLASAALLGAGMMMSPVEVQLVGRHLDYPTPHYFLVLSVGLYLLATTLSLSLSSLPRIRAYGLLSVAAAAVAYAVYAQWFVSVWCFFAGLLSVLVYLVIHHAALANGPSQRRGFAAASPTTPARQ